jgi:alkylhydroperoxidase family enzyme
MARIPYAAAIQAAELIRQSGLPRSTPQPNAFLMFAHTPAVGAAVLQLVLALVTDTDLEPSVREMVILRVVQRCQGRYAWVQRVAMARNVGVCSAQIAALERGEAPAHLFAKRECSAFALADEVIETSRASEETLADVLEQFSARQVVELLLLIGYFRMVCGVMTTLGVEVESPCGLELVSSVRDAARDRGKNIGRGGETSAGQDGELINADRVLFPMADV